MKPIFKNTEDWQKAELLMQPAFIRVMDNLRKQLEQSHWIATYQEVETPYPGHQLSLTYQENSVTMGIWDICFQVCFLDYKIPLINDKKSSQNTQIVDIDSNLLNERGEVDWQHLDAKVQRIIQEILTNLPTD